MAVGLSPPFFLRASPTWVLPGPACANKKYSSLPHEMSIYNTDRVI